MTVEIRAADPAEMARAMWWTNLYESHWAVCRARRMGLDCRRCEQLESNALDAAERAIGVTRCTTP